MPISDYMRRLREKVGTDLIMMPGAAALIFNDAGEVLLQRRSDSGQWGLPGGAIDPGEEPADAIIREAFEETGLIVKPERIVGVYGGPDYLHTYPNGDRVAIISIAFYCTIVGGHLHIADDESLELRFFSPDALPPRQWLRERVNDALRGEERAIFKLQGSWLNGHGQQIERLPHPDSSRADDRQQG
jgi:8-oxo-dGTP diphosphatase